MLLTLFPLISNNRLVSNNEGVGKIESSLAAMTVTNADEDNSKNTYNKQTNSLSSLRYSRELTGHKYALTCSLSV